MGTSPLRTLLITSATYLTNYKNPYITASGTVNPNNSSRFLKLAMRTSRSKWQDANAIVKGNSTTGAHIDTSHHNDIQFETQWSGFATPLLDYRLWQAITLPAGRYRFSIVPGDVDDMQTSRLVACEGSTMVSDAACEEKALAWCKLMDGSINFNHVDFSYKTGKGEKTLQDIDIGTINRIISVHITPPFHIFSGIFWADCSGAVH